jgi:hypothetical protein
MRFSTFPVCAVLALSAGASPRPVSSGNSFRHPATTVSIDSTIDAATRNAVIVAALKALNDGYIFPDIAAKMDRDIRVRMGRGEFDSLGSATQFASTLTARLRDISHDKHIAVEWSRDAIPERTNAAPGARDTVAERARERKESDYFAFPFLSE